jgi:hypothetical protein
LHIPKQLIEQKDLMIDILCEIAHVREAQTFKDLDVIFEANNVKFVEEL